jgi:Ca2+/Na+ antiporter
MILAATALIPLSMAIFGFSALLSLVGIGSYIAFVIYSFVCKPKTEESHKKKDIETAGNPDKAGEESDSDSEEEHNDASLLKGIGYLIVGGGLIFFCSEPFIEAVVEVSEKLHVNPILLAFFLAPVASEMPEILESISLSRKGKENSINIAFSNLVGGTITKTTLLCGVRI